MATYYPTSSPQTDVFTSPYANMMMYLNPASSSGCFSEISSMNPQNHIEIPSMATRNEMMFIPPTGADPISIQTINGQINPESAENLQGLSLSLNTHMPTSVSSPSFQFQYSNPGISFVLSPHLPLSAENSVRQMACKVDEVSPSHKEIRNSDYFGYNLQGDVRNLYQYEQSGVGGPILKSKYFKAAQELLDEVVNVRDAVRKSQSDKHPSSSKVDEGSKESGGGSQPPFETDESGNGSGSSHELSQGERQELQSKLDKLHSMLDEVDKRYKQYCHQMQVLASSFDVIAGNGASKPYTSLALKTISRHFRCLHDAITNQIQTTRKSLGDHDNGVGGVIPRLRYVDQQLRQQRALQQFGMMRHTWRPQRGLPENAVTILRAWLFEHFLHPYPKDSEKIMLARQTGLSRGQVANWFINARVRLWKPMIEEMYKEEFGDGVDTHSKSSQENIPKLEHKTEEMQETTGGSGSMSHHDSKIGPPGPSYGFYSNGSIPTEPNGSGHLMVSPYQIPELGNFGAGNNNQVSLALGLRHSEGDLVTMSSETEEPTMGVGVGISDFPYADQVNPQRRFGNLHILNDFVA